MAHKTLFLHGFGEDVRVWADFLPHFSWPYDVICPDYASWTACATMADYARQIVSTLEDADTFSIVGHSMGGYIALEIARLYPDRVRTVIMLHSTLFADSAEKKLNRDKTIAFLRQHGSSKFLQSFVSQLFAPVFVKQNSGLMKDLQQRYRDLAVDGLIASTSAMRDRHDFESFMRQTNIPFLFILGEENGCNLHHIFLNHWY